MSGINKKPLPVGDVTMHPNGSLTLSSSGGRQYGVRANGTVASYSAKGQTASFDNKGRISSLHTSNMDIHHAANGGRSIVTKRADNSVLVSSGSHNGYLQRTVVQNNQTYIQRTAVSNNVVVTRTFVTYNYGGVVLTHYVTPVYFAPVFYGWAYHPWIAPIGFSWGWAGAPWYVGPSPYFVAYPTYPSASFWLTDYFLGETLALAAERRAEALRDASYETESSADMSASDEAGAERTQVAHAEGTTPITPELKAAIANEVREQLAYDNEAAQSGNTTPTADRGDLPSVLQTPNYVFVVSNDLDVMTLDQQQCGLQAGDILQLSTTPGAGSPVVQLRVVSSKRMDCPAGVQVTVSLQDLQDMHNTFRSQIEAGLGTLHDKMGHDGLPAAPQLAVAAPPRPSIASLTPNSGDDVTALLKDQQEQANQAEAVITGSAFETQN
jgi:hypothetical protein